jgi:transposase
MALLYRRCAGLDVHRDTVAACIRVRVGHGQYEEQRQTFATFSLDLKRLSRWLKDNGVRHVAMESTGVYWIPVWNTLEPSRYKFQLTLVNPAQIRALAGHKTDQIDSGRIAEFLQHGRLAGSFIPPISIREARGLERRRGSGAPHAGDHLLHHWRWSLTKSRAMITSTGFLRAAQPIA